MEAGVDDANVTEMRMRLPEAGEHVKYAVLRHGGGGGVEKEHFDVLVEVEGAERLLTWLVFVPPERWGGGWG